MPRYEYRCRTCADTFELRRSMADADAPVQCPAGHDDTTRLLSVFASVSATDAPAAPGPCGGACACAPG